MVGSWLFPLLLAIFVAAAAAVWFAGSRLSDTTDVLAERLGIGQALGGVILLAIATNLPELAITVSAAVRHELGIAIGNILGGIAIQTVVLVVLDIIGVGSAGALTYEAASLVLVLEGALVVGVLVVAIMGSRLPATLDFARVGPGAVLIAILWTIGLWLLGKARADLPWQAKGDAPGGQDRGGKAHAHKQASLAGVGTVRIALVFAAAAVVTLVAGVALERSGEAMAARAGMSGVLFGATVLAASTSLPEVSTGLASIRLGDYRLAISDIFGGNAFLPVLILLAALISGQSVLPQAHDTDVYLAGLGILLTVVYLFGLIFRPRRQILRMGIDSLAVLVLYLVGLAGLLAIVHG